MRLSAASEPRDFRARIPFLLFLVPYALWVAGTFRDYGVTFDEYATYWAGKYLLENIFLGRWHDVLLQGSGWPVDVRHYHHLYPALLYALTGKLSIPSFHFWNMVFGGFIFWFSYEMLLRATRKPWASLLGPVILACMPRFLGDIPNNPKDLSFALFNMAFLALLFLWRDRLSVLRCLALGLVLGLAVGARTIGLSLPLLWLMWLGYERLRNSNAKGTPFFSRKHIIDGLSAFAILISVSAVCLLSTWPWLRSAPLANAWYLLKISHQFPWDGLVLFNGFQTPASHLPLSYLPVWWGSTVPLVWLCLPILLPFILFKTKDSLLSLLGLVLLFHAVLYFLVHPVLYDGLRHYLFLLPVWATACALVSIRLWERFTTRSHRMVLAAIIGLQVLATGRAMILLHPFEYLYFNAGAGGLHGASGKLELDYMGSTYKEAVEWLNGHLPPGSGKYNVNTEGHAFQSAYYFGPRLTWTDRPDADYYIATTRGDKQLTAPADQVIHIVARDGVPLCYVFRLKE